MRAGLLDLIRRWCLLLVVASTVLFLRDEALAEQPAAPTGDAANTFKSTFANDVAYGKDPFFPRSTRREAKAPAPVELPPVELAIDGLELRGMSGNGPARLAIINNRTFAVGEELTVKIRDQKIPVKCVEIRENSVVVNVGGLTRELHFRKK